MKKFSALLFVFGLMLCTGSVTGFSQDVKDVAEKVVDKTKEVGEKVIDKTKDTAKKVASETKKGAKKVVEKSKDGAVEGQIKPRCGDKRVGT